MTGWTVNTPDGVVWRDLSASSLARAVPSVAQALEVATNRLPGLPVPSLSPVVNDLRPLGPWLRGFDYTQLVTLLAEGWYEEEQHA